MGRIGHVIAYVKDMPLCEFPTKDEYKVYIKVILPDIDPFDVTTVKLTQDKDFCDQPYQAYNLGTLRINFMSIKKYPGVYELLVKKKDINVPVYLCIAYVTDSQEGSTVEYDGKKYIVINRSGLSPTGRLVLKEVPKQGQ